RRSGWTVRGLAGSGGWLVACTGSTTGPTDGVGMNGVALSGRAVLPTVADPALIAATDRHRGGAGEQRHGEEIAPGGAAQARVPVRPDHPPVAASAGRAVSTEQRRTGTLSWLGHRRTPRRRPWQGLGRAPPATTRTTVGGLSFRHQPAWTSDAQFTSQHSVSTHNLSA
ncbi:hypothetical protein JNW88_27945, partial [Micromonospora sp. ATA32]|nr:hypothetical protein [Micromonospora sp. ATA32]